MRTLPTCRTVHALLLTAVFLGVPAAMAEPPTFASFVTDDPPPRTVVYRRVGERELKLFLFPPPATAGAGPFPVVVAIHGGGWKMGTPDLVYAHCRYFAARGAFAVSVNYRLADGEQVQIGDCVADVRAAVRWLLAHAAEERLDPRRVVLTGDSAGGHLAAAAALLPDPEADAPGATTKPLRPAALVLFNPVVDIAALPWRRYAPGLSRLPTGDLPADSPARVLSPCEFVRSGLPPTLIVHGVLDPVVPIPQVRRFAAAMKEARNDCELLELAKTTHAFVLPGYAPVPTTQNAVLAMDRFLVRLEVLPGPPLLAELPPAPDVPAAAGDPR